MRLTPGAQASAALSGVPASITIAQAALESAWGESGLARNGNNLFGIKADSLWRGETLTMNTREFIKGHWVVVPALWRKYPSWQASTQDHAAFLRRNKRYAACFACTTGKTFAQAVAKAGYATDPRYADKLISMIDKYQLEALDLPPEAT
ncbi:glycoside hydrolase family 73 protein [Limnohabitans sp.]|uniref:glycoside hydrolase family 73 protein n=1 Tax=Limnohabitans sp. TaxID=1907725 RepID=UPI00311E8A45